MSNAYLLYFVRRLMNFLPLFKWYFIFFDWIKIYLPPNFRNRIAFRYNELVIYLGLSEAQSFLNVYENPDKSFRIVLQIPSIHCISKDYKQGLSWFYVRLTWSKVYICAMSMFKLFEAFWFTSAPLSQDG